MQIDIDFEVFKALTAQRIDEGDTYNAVLRRLLALPTKIESGPLEPVTDANVPAKGMMFRGASNRRHGPATSLIGNLLLGGAIFNGVILPAGTRFRATYKGVLYTAEIKDGRWVDQDGIVRTSPSDAASAISGTNVNGWKFWSVKRPDDAEWTRLDALK